MIFRYRAVVCTSLLTLVTGSSAIVAGCVGDEPSVGVDDDDSGSDDAPNGADTSTDDGSTVEDAADGAPACLPPVSASPGTLETSFGVGFKPITNGFVPFAFAIDGAGRAYVAGQAFNCVSGGSSYDYAVVRFTETGDVDTTFNPGLKPLCFDFGTGGEAAQAIAIDADGKIVIGGLGGATSSYVAEVIRIDATGALDTSFNGSGKLAGLYDDGDGGGGYPIDGGKFISVNGIGFFGDKIVLAGSDDNNPTYRKGGFVSRLNHDGTIDASFAGGLPYVDKTNVGGFSKLVVDADGKVAVVGGYGADATPDFIVERLTASGTLDPSFATGGIYAPGPFTGSGTDVSHAIRAMPGGGYVIAGAVGSHDTFSGTAALVMLDANGKVVPSFGTNGLFVGPTALVNHTLTLDSPIAALCGNDFFYAGKELATDGGGVGNANDVGIIHVLANGTLDTSFGNAGTGHAGLTTVINVVAVAEDPVAQKPIVIATNAAHQVGVFRFEP